MSSCGFTDESEPNRNIDNSLSGDLSMDSGPETGEVLPPEPVAIPIFNIAMSLLQPVVSSVCTVIAEGTPEDETDSILQRELNSRLTSRHLSEKGASRLSLNLISNDASCKKAQEPSIRD